MVSHSGSGSTHKKLVLFIVLVTKSCPTCGHKDVTQWTVAHQPSLSMEFSRQEHWSGLPFPSPEYLPPLRVRIRVSCIGRQILYC